MRPFLTLCLASLLSGSARAATLSDLAAGDLLITEILPNPAAVPYYRGQWFEVYNNSGVSVNLNGLVVSDGATETFTVSSSVTVAAGDYAIFAVRSNSAVNGGITGVDVVYSLSAFSLSAGSDTITISHGATTFDSVTYNDLDFPDPYGASMSLAPVSFSSTDNDDGANWCEPYSTYGSGDYGTPGSANDDCPDTLDALGAGDLLITEVLHTPLASDYNKGEWFEIYNASATYVDLDGLVIDSGTGEQLVVSGQQPLRPGAYAVFAARDNPLQNGNIPSVDYRYIYGTELTLSDTDTLELSYGVVVFDSLTWNNTTFPHTAGVAMELGTGNYDATNNDTDTSWCDASLVYGDGDYGTPGSENGDCNTDTDGDGYTEDVDCDDNDANIHPGAVEICDDIDNDCNDLVDDSPSDGTTWYADTDNDFYGDAGNTTVACDKPSGYRANSLDCDDTTASINPGATETCDGTDNNCSGSETDANDAADWYPDADSDGYGNQSAPVAACTQPSGYIADGSDCNDASASINPGAAETCDGTDNNCSGDENDASDANTYYADVDKDLYGDPGNTRLACTRPSGYRTNSLDCNDANASIKPGAAETCDGTDNNCSGDESDASDATDWYPDSDSDGYGDESAPTSACTQPSGYIADGSDCDDTNAAVNPGESETCDGTDNNCSGNENDASDANTYYADTDSDFYGDPGNTRLACTRPSGYRTNSLDCDDTNAGIKPGAAETCDGTDNNCSGDESDASDAADWYPDSDSDGYGDESAPTPACTQPSGYIADGSDCDDASASVYPGAPETCDGTDNNCSGNENDASDANTYYADTDSDFYGDAGNTTLACTRPSGYRTNSLDCDDSSAGINPGATETCDGTDNNCSGDENDANDATDWYADADSDTYGDLSSTTPACTQPSGYVADSTDCDDTSASVYPGAAETCDGTDNNCSGDENDASDASTWFADVDSDAYGDLSSTTPACTQPSGYVADSTDCDDANAGINPGETETCDGTDNNCSGDETDATDQSTWYADADSDAYGDVGSTTQSCTQPSGYVADSTDCDDAAVGVNPGETETCDGTDNNCSGDELDATDILTWYADADSDAYGDVGSTTQSCTQPGGYVADSTDCDDAAVGVNPGETETCDGTDNNCSGDESDAIDATTWFADLDTDTYGDPNSSTLSCVQPGGYVADSSDCDDADAGISPDADEVCNDGTDSDCDGYDSNSVCEASLGDADAVFYGETAADRAGYSVDGGDINGDGYSDVVVGARLTDTSGADAGSTYVYFGPISGSAPLGSADGKLNGESAGDYAGITVAAGGDVNSDGYDDLLIGALNEDHGGTDAGAAYLILGPFSGTSGLAAATDAKLHGVNAGDNAGRALAHVGDYDNDGYDDFVVASYTNDDTYLNGGAVYLFLGPVSSDASLSTADVTFTPVAEQDYAGYWVAGGGDSDADGYTEVLINAYRADTVVEGNTLYNVGVSYLVNGPTTGTVDLSTADAIFVGIADNDQAGQCLADAGDVNNDGYDDVIIGAQFADDGGTSAGTAYLLYGPFSGNVGLDSANATFIGEAASDNAGRAVDGLGDLNNDGYDDIIIGAKTNDTAATDAGAAYIILGPATGSSSLSVADGILLGESSSDQAGIAVAGAGDVSGDGSPDILVGAVVGGGASEPGAAYLLFGDAWR